MLRPSLQSVSELSAVDRLPINKRMLNVQQFFIGTVALHLFVPWGSFIPILIFLHFFGFELGAVTEETDGHIITTIIDKLIEH